VVERSERYASAAKPEEPQDTKRRAWAALVRCWFFLPPDWVFLHFAPNARRARRKIAFLFKPYSHITKWWFFESIPHINGFCIR
jgi:hypothetical protein